MTTNGKVIKPASLGDRFAEFSVVLLTVVALTAGWMFKSGVENRSLSFTSGNITAQVPAGWIKLGTSGNEVLHVTDRATSGYGTTYLIQVETVPADAQVSEAVSLLSLERGNSLTGYRVLNQQNVIVQGRNAIEIDYVYVESADNLGNAVIPAVVRGQDFVFVNNGQAVIVTYRADQSVYETDLGRFYHFLVSVNY